MNIQFFRSHLRTRFRIPRAQAPAIELELIEAECLARGRAGADREPFTLIFRGPPAPALGQGTYRLEHDAGGPLEIFLVPIGPEGDPLGPHYQATFN